MISQGSQIVTTPGTAVNISTANTPVSFITIFPRTVLGVGNTGEVRVGGRPPTSAAGAIPPGTGMPLQPGDAGVVWPFGGTAATQLSDIYIDADNANDGVQFLFGAP